MTTKPGSLRPLSRAAMVAAGTPTTTERTMPARVSPSSVRGAGWSSRADPAQSRVAATEPQVPGPGLPRPAPKKVAMVQAHRVLRPARKEHAGPSGQPPLAAMSRAASRAPAWDWSLAACLALRLSVTFLAFEVFKRVGGEHGRADFVDAHGPLAQIDAAAAV